MMDALGEWRAGKVSRGNNDLAEADGTPCQLAAVGLDIAAGSRGLAAQADSGIELALNGRVGRRVACILDRADMGLEILDMAGEEELASEDGERSGGHSPDIG